jgi:hypothetical protein
MVKKLEVRDRRGRFQWITVDLGEEEIHYVAVSQNHKTGPLPTQWIGDTREQSEETCRICPLWERNVCYSQDGSPRLGHASLLRKVRVGEDRSVQYAVDNAQRNAKYVRFGAIGDPGSINEDVYKDHENRFREAGFGVISYTHQWYLDHAQFLKDTALASADTMKDVHDAHKAGWRVAVHVDEKDLVFNGKTIVDSPQGVLPDGTKYFLCPAQRTNNKVTCNTCGLCDHKKPTKYDCIVFVEHGNQLKYEKQRKARREAEYTD